ncbi:hypothetical protein TNCT_183521 [Trichonephila clavata]|uniref:Uncharacterized protein n=1 Tax=Trichonephila clavata TaxID=2740835 RepID=A0A8X6JCE9_TRICU|nr:hypothetical protein TNCT_183521 [Trichonephila clavata]
MSAMSQRSHLTESEAWRLVSRLDEAKHKLEFHKVLFSGSGNIFWRLEMPTKYQGKVVDVQQCPMKIDI